MQLKAWVKGYWKLFNCKGTKLKGFLLEIWTVSCLISFVQWYKNQQESIQHFRSRSFHSFLLKTLQFGSKYILYLKPQASQSIKLTLNFNLITVLCDILLFREISCWFRNIIIGPGKLPCPLWFPPHHNSAQAAQHGGSTQYGVCVQQLESKYFISGNHHNKKILILLLVRRILLWVHLKDISKHLKTVKLSSFPSFRHFLTGCSAIYNSQHALSWNLRLFFPQFIVKPLRSSLSCRKRGGNHSGCCNEHLEYLQKPFTNCAAAFSWGCSCSAAPDSVVPVLLWSLGFVRAALSLQEGISSSLSLQAPHPAKPAGRSQARQLLQSWDLPIPSQLRGLNTPSDYGSVSTSLWVLQPGCKQLPDLFNTSLGAENFIKYSAFQHQGEHVSKIKLFLIPIISFT